MAILDVRGFFDDSGTHDSADARVMGGFIAQASVWEDLKAEWSPVIKEAGLTAYESTDSTMKRNEFKDWTWEKADELHRKLVSIINNHPLNGFGVSVDMKAFNRVVPKEKIGQIEDPYFIGMLACFCIVANHAKAAPAEEKIAYIFDRQRIGISSRAIEIYNGIMDHYDGANRFRLSGSLGFGSRVDFIPLQPADIIAYQTFLEHCRQINKYAPKPNRAFQALNKRNNCGFCFFDEKGIRMMIDDPNAIEKLF